MRRGSNLLAVRVFSAAESVGEWEGERLQLPLAGHADGDPPTLLLRPEELALAAAGASGAGVNRLDGVVEAPSRSSVPSCAWRRPCADGRSGSTSRTPPRALERRKPVTPAFAPADVLASGAPGAA